MSCQKENGSNFNFRLEHRLLEPGGTLTRKLSIFQMVGQYINQQSSNNGNCQENEDSYIQQDYQNQKDSQELN
jgi:hypothetical protein